MAIRLNGVLAALFASAFAMQPPDASAQSSEDRARAVRRELRQQDRDDRFAHAVRRCNDMISAREEMMMGAWCAAATEGAVEARRRGRRGYNDAETAHLLDAAWLVAVKGVQEAPLQYSRSPLRDVEFSDDDALRALAYQLIGDLRCNCNPSAAIFALLAHLDLNVADFQSLGAARAQALDILLAEPRTPGRLWAASAIASTVRYERVDLLSVERIRGEAAAVAARLAPLTPEVENLSGRDSSLYPMLLHVRGEALRLANDVDGAQPILDAGAGACVQRIWTTADLCLDLAYAAAQATLMIEDRATHPELVDLMMPLAIVRPPHGNISPRTPCTALIIGDIDEAGALTNVRIGFQTPGNVCETFALDYATQLRYVPAADLKDQERRTDVFVRLQYHPQ